LFKIFLLILYLINFVVMSIRNTKMVCTDSPHDSECIVPGSSIFGYSQMEFRESSPIDGLNIIEYEGDDGVSYSIISDVSLLFDQKRLNSALGPDTVRVWLNSLGDSASALIPKNMTDDQLFSAVKSRHIQGLSDLRAWNDEMLREAMSIEDQAKDLIDNYNSSDGPSGSDAPVSSSPNPS
jgi:hypothetical protein